MGLGEGDAVADIGAGNGQDSWVFAEIVGRSGVVYAEEITDELVKSLRDKAEEKRLSQVRAVRGQVDDLGQIEALDLAYMRYVYHHFSKPREMLRAIWRALKPGGCLVVVDREPGTLKDWASREERRDKHHWTGETTVIREAREEGFRVVGCAEDCCELPEPFVLIFQRPKGTKVPGGDPDPLLPLPVQEITGQFTPLSRPYERPVFIAMGQARELMFPIMQQSTGPGLDIVLEEWATQKDERPPLPLGLSMPSVLTTNGDPGLSTEPIDAVFFLDSFHLSFHGNTLLTQLRERLRPDGCVYILDRAATRPLSRRGASHHRQIDPLQVKDELAAVGYFLWFEGPPPAPDRFLQIYGTKGPQRNNLNDSTVAARLCSSNRRETALA
ncbi:MAG: methyltransferase domain-containing protein [Phycisphaerae bacterium]|nr:methyltransferase domain-containing protein [Phycisphaerae bacterium]